MPATSVPVLLGTTAPFAQPTGNVANATQCPVALPSLQVGGELGKLLHQWRSVIGVPDDVVYVKFNGSVEPGFTGVFVVVDSPKNPLKPTVPPTGTDAAVGSNAATQQEVVPLPLPFSGSKVGKGAV